MPPKKLLIILVSTLLSFTSFGQNVNKQDGLTYVDTNYKVLYTGTWEDKYMNGLPRFIQPYINGLKEGIGKAYYNGGKQIESIVTYLNGKHHGESISYHRNGKISCKSYWEADKREGEWIYYDTNGIEISRTVYSDDKIISSTLKQ